MPGCHGVEFGNTVPAFHPPGGDAPGERREDMYARDLSNQDLFESYKDKRGDIASEMSRRAGTIGYLLKYCEDDDKKFYSCMRDT